jgi:hypothetical protein
LVVSHAASCVPRGMLYVVPRGMLYVAPRGMLYVAPRGMLYVAPRALRHGALPSVVWRWCQLAVTHSHSGPFPLRLIPTQAHSHLGQCHLARTHSDVFRLRPVPTWPVPLPLGVYSLRLLRALEPTRGGAFAVFAQVNFDLMRRRVPTSPFPLPLGPVRTTQCSTLPRDCRYFEWLSPTALGLVDRAHLGHLQVCPRRTY